MSLVSALQTFKLYKQPCNCKSWSIINCTCRLNGSASRKTIVQTGGHSKCNMPCSQTSCICEGCLLCTKLHHVTNGVKNITAQQTLITAQQMLTHGMPQLLIGVSMNVPMPCICVLNVIHICRTKSLDLSHPKSVQLVKQPYSKSCSSTISLMWKLWMNACRAFCFHACP